MRVLLVLVGLQLVGLALLLSPWGSAPHPDRIAVHLVTLALTFNAAWLIAYLAPTHPRAALILLRVALVYSTLEAVNAIGW